MESSSQNKHRILAITFVTFLCLSITSVLAETYRWKDESGKVHYGATVPAEFADQPYDVLNNAGVVIKHVEKSTIPRVVIVEEEVKGEEPLIPDDVRQRQSDRLLLLQYRSEEEIQTALDHELGQLGYDIKLIRQSQQSTAKTIRDQVRLAADRQRADLDIKDDQQKAIDNLYVRREKDEKKLEAVKTRELQLRERFQVKLERYRDLISKYKAIEEARADQG